MAFGRCRTRLPRTVWLNALAVTLLCGCTMNPQLRSTLSDLGINVPDSSTQGASPAAAASAPEGTAAPASAPPSAPAGATTGWVVGSIGEIPQAMFSLDQSGSPYGNVQIGFHGQSGQVHDSIDFSTAQIYPTPLDFEADKEKSATFAIRLPPGEYLIDSLRFTQSTDMSNTPCLVENQLAIPFTVRQDEATYLGSLIASADWEKNRHNLLAPTCGYFVVHDRSARDEPVIRKKFPGVGDRFVTHLLVADTPQAQKYFRSP